jgi:hypothetical protein
MAVLLLGVVAAQSAQASPGAYWSIQGSRLKKGQTHFITAKILNQGTAGATFVLTAGSNVITCKALSTPNGVLLGSEEGEEGTNNEILKFTECTAKAGTETCTAVNSPGEPNQTFTPENKEFEFVTIDLAGGATCTALSGGLVTGQVVAQVLTDETTPLVVELGVVRAAATSWLLKVPNPQPSHLWLVVNGTGVESAKLEGLELAGVKATQEGTALILLANTKRETEPNTLWSPLP